MGCAAKDAAIEVLDQKMKVWDFGNINGCLVI